MKRRTAKKARARARRWLAQRRSSAPTTAPGSLSWEHVQMAKEKLVHDAVMARLGDLEGQLGGGSKDVRDAGGWD